jgi:hypothetical protein
LLDTADPMLKERTLPDGVEAELWLESRRVQLDTRAAPPPPTPEEQNRTDADEQTLEQVELSAESEDESAKLLAPQIVLQAAGDLVPFELLLRSSSSDEIRAIRGTIEGVIDVRDPRADQRP